MLTCARTCSWFVALALALSLCACLQQPNSNTPAGPSRLQAVHFADPIRPLASEPPIMLRGARNETVQFAIQINQFPNDLSSKKLNALRFQPLQSPAEGGIIPVTQYSAYQLLPLPIDANKAGFVRHTGLDVSERHFPRALLPLGMDKGIIPLAALRSADAPTDPASRGRPGDSAPPMVWVDVQIPPTIPPGTYKTTCELVEEGKAAGFIAIQLTVDEFVIPDERHLLMVGHVNWPDLVRLYPDHFKGLQPALLSRREDRSAPAIRTLDGIVKLAQAHRAQVVIPALQPLVKWPSGAPVQIDWSDFDALLGPWLKGEAFPDSIPLGYWPIPFPSRLERHDLTSQLEYFQAAASHFDQLDWLLRSAVPIERRTTARIRIGESVEISELAAKILAIHPRIRVSVPLEEEQVQLASPQHPKWLAQQDLHRLLYVAPSLVSVPPLQRLPEGLGMRWLRTDLPGLIPNIGSGADEREVRLWAFLAYLRSAQLIQWPSILPSRSDPASPGDPDELIWFYPGAWFGIDQPVPTVQLKWLRRAQQDYEYLYLARVRGQSARALTLARLITRPVELQPAQDEDPTYALLSGTSQPGAWDELLGLLARTINLSKPGQSIDPVAEKQLAYDITSWSQTQERPLLMARNVDWALGVLDMEGNSWLNLTLGIDVYNAADRQPDKNTLQWTGVPEAWSVPRKISEVPKLSTYTVRRFPLEARINLDQITPATRQPVKLMFVDGHTNKPFPLELMLPVAWSERRDGPPPQPDFSLADWSAADAVHEGKFVQMLSRPSVQQQELQWAPTPSALYSTWTAGHFYVAFKVEGADAPLSNAESNFIKREFRRAWGEDICEVLMQPVYEDRTLGPLLHLAFKPRGQLEISRRLDPKQTANPWQAFAASDIQYAALTDGPTWRGELVIPWEAMSPPGKPTQRPVLLRFNFIQHRGSTGQSSSWAGPIDSGRDETFMGLLEIRQAQ